MWKGSNWRSSKIFNLLNSSVHVMNLKQSLSPQARLDSSSHPALLLQKIIVFCKSCWRHNCASLWRENWETFPVNSPTYILPLIGLITVFYFVDLRALGRGSLLTSVLLSTLLWNSSWENFKKWTRSVLCRNITLYLMYLVWCPWKLIKETVISSEDLLAFPSSLQVTSYWCFSVLPLEIETETSLAVMVLWRDFNIKSALTLPCMKDCNITLRMCNSYCNTGLKS